MVPGMGSPTAEGPRVVGGRYRLLDKIGSGGMGTVWRAHDELLGRTVAVKEVHLPPQLAAIERAELRLRTMREARAAARLSHPNAVTVHDVIERDGQPWIVMQLVAADSLSDVIERSEVLPPRRVAEIGLAILAALQAAHAAGILHRDVKPANVLLGGDGQVVLTDFGVATLEGDPSLTGTGLLLGSPSYIAPERAMGIGAGAASDLWSLGATLYAAVEGRPPFERTTAMATLAALATEDPPAPRASGPLAEAITGLLQRDPGGRLDAPAARRLLEDAATGATDRSAATVNIPGLAPTGVPELVDQTRIDQRPDLARTDPIWVDPPPAPLPPPRRRRRWIVTTLVLLVALGGGVAAAAYLSDSGDRPPDPRPSPSSTPATAVLPAAFVGRWSGDLDQTNGPKVATVDLQLYAGALGSLVGTSSYPKLGCSGELRLVSVGTDGSMRLAEKILVQSTARRCTPTVTIDLDLLPDGLNFVGSDGFTGKLSPGAPTG